MLCPVWVGGGRGGVVLVCWLRSHPRAERIVSRRYDRAAPQADDNAGWGGERSWQSRTGFAGRERTGKAACQLRCEGGALSGGRRRIVVDAGEGPGGWLDAGSGGEGGAPRVGQI